MTLDMIQKEVLDIRPVPSVTIKTGGTVPPPPGFYNMTDQLYHACPAVDYSGMKVFDSESPAHYKAAAAWKPSDDKDVGSAFHMKLLQPQEVYDQRVSVASGRRAPKWRDNLEEGSYLLTEGAEEKVKGMMSALDEDTEEAAQAKALLSKGIGELAGFWVDPVTGLLCKMLLDWYSTAFDKVVDVKTTGQGAGKWAFEKTINNFKYHWQAGFYLDGLQVLMGSIREEWIWMVFETEAPWQLCLYLCHEEAIAEARAEYRPVMERWAECVEKDHWPKKPGGLRTISLPGWKKRKAHNSAIYN